MWKSRGCWTDRNRGRLRGEFSQFVVLSVWDAVWVLTHPPPALGMSAGVWSIALRFPHCLIPSSAAQRNLFNISVVSPRWHWDELESKCTRLLKCPASFSVIYNTFTHANATPLAAELPACSDSGFNNYIHHDYSLYPQRRSTERNMQGKSLFLSLHFNHRQKICRKTVFFFCD